MTVERFQLLATLWTALEKHPNLRLGQLLLNLIRSNERLYGVSDKEIRKRLQMLIDEDDWGVL